MLCSSLIYQGLYETSDLRCYSTGEPSEIVAKKITSSADRMSTELSLGWISLDERPWDSAFSKHKRQRFQQHPIAKSDVYRSVPNLSFPDSGRFKGCTVNVQDLGFRHRDGHCSCIRLRSLCPSINIQKFLACGSSYLACHQTEIF
jgi:hypothetical protein